jgi:hypothetical protein
MTAVPVPASKTRLQIICPGLFGSADLMAGRNPQTPCLDRLLARADHLDHQPRDPLATLAEAFAIQSPPDRDLATAPLCLLAEVPGRMHKGCWFHADPVHLRPDRDQLRLLAGPSLELQPAEAAALVDTFNGHFAEDGLSLTAPRPSAWYLRVDRPPDLHTHPLHAVAGHALAGFLPSGVDARHWNRWQNEAQMLFYDHPVNLERERQGRPIISGVWTWGGGGLPLVAGGPDLTIADHPLAVGLARAASQARLGLDALAQRPLAWQGSESAEVLIFWDAFWWPALTGDAETWCAALVGLELLLERLDAAQANGQFESLTLDDGECQAFTLTTWGRRRFWRRGGFRERLTTG